MVAMTTRMVMTRVTMMKVVVMKVVVREKEQGQLSYLITF